MACVDLQSLSKSFGTVDVIHSVDIDLPDGEFLALVGPSGCGKSTLLRIIAGLEDATDGEVLMDGKIVTDLNSRQRNVAMVFQSYALYPHMTVEKNIGFNLRLSGKSRPEIKTRVAEAARLLELTDLLSRRPYQLSGGQRQRVAMGRAIVRNPAVFLFDEPLSNLDAKLRVQMRTEIKALHQKVRTTSIYVTHDQIEAMTLADRIAVLNGGRVEQQGSPIELYSRPGNVFVAGFIGSPSMNFLDATVEPGSSGPMARLSDGTSIALPADCAALEGQPVVLGLRPEHLALAASGSLGGPVRFVEPTGAQTHVTFDIAGSATVALVDGMTQVESGQKLSFEIPPNQVHVFDRATGNRL